MSLKLTISADSSPIEAIFKRLNQFNADKSELFNDIGAHLANSTRERFVHGVDVNGNPWKESWRARMQGRNGVGSGETLRDTGRLMNSYTYNVLPNGLEVGTDVRYAAPLHFGATILPKNGQYITFAVGGQYRRVKKSVLPARTQLGIDTEDEDNVLDIIGAFISDYILRSS